MKWPPWPWRRSKNGRRIVDQRAQEADRLTREQAEEAHRRLAESKALAARFRALREKNHFAEGFHNALGEGR